MTASLLMFLAAGLVGGLLLGMIGMGMALVAVPFVSFVLPRFGIPAEAVPLTAVATSMGIVAVGSVSSAIAHHRRGNVAWIIVKTMLPFGLAGMALGSLVAPLLPGGVLRWVFAGFLVFVAIGMLRPTRAGSEAPVQTSAARYRGTGALIGVAGSLIGAGGGVFMVPFLDSRGHSMATAVATSTVIGLPVTVLGTLLYAAQPSGLDNAMLLGHVFLPAFIGISLGSIVTAPLGARLASKVPGALLKRGFATVLLILAARLAME